MSSSEDSGSYFVVSMSDVETKNSFTELMFT